MLESVVM